MIAKKQFILVLILICGMGMGVTGQKTTLNFFTGFAIAKPDKRTNFTLNNTNGLTANAVSYHKASYFNEYYYTFSYTISRKEANYPTEPNRGRQQL